MPPHQEEQCNGVLASSAVPPINAAANGDASAVGEGGSGLYGEDHPEWNVEQALLHRMFEELMAKQGSQLNFKVRCTRKTEIYVLNVDD